MKMTLNEIDEQIRDVENRIAVERLALDDAVHGCTNSLREAITSPKTLLALLGVGYAIGKVLFKEKAAPPQQGPVKKAGALGLLTGVAGTVLSMGGSKWGSVARWAAGRYFARRNAAKAARPGAPAVTRSVPVPPYPRTPAGL